jgi:hypothetical protein
MPFPDTKKKKLLFLAMATIEGTFGWARFDHLQ